MIEWVLILWTVSCGFADCSPRDMREFAVYATQARCQEALLDWTITERTRHMEPAYRRRNYDLGGKCMMRSVPEEQNCE